MGEKAVYIQTEGMQLRLRPLTLKLFNDHLKAIVAGPLSFSSDEEVQTYYQETYFY